MASRKNVPQLFEAYLAAKQQADGLSKALLVMADESVSKARDGAEDRRFRALHSALREPCQKQSDFALKARLLADWLDGQDCPVGVEEFFAEIISFSEVANV